MMLHLSFAHVLPPQIILLIVSDFHRFYYIQIILLCIMLFALHVFSLLHQAIIERNLWHTGLKIQREEYKT